MRSLIVDDNEAFLEAATVLLEREGIAVVGVALTGADALGQAKALRPDVVLVDIWLREESGIQLGQRLVHDLGDDAAVVLISTRSEEEVADLIATSPVAGFLSKAELSAAAIRRVVDGRAR